MYETKLAVKLPETGKEFPDLGKAYLNKTNCISARIKQAICNLCLNN